MIPRRTIIGVLAVTAGLSACTTLEPEGYPLSRTVSDCLKHRPLFVDVWGCVQTRYASGQMGDPDKRVAAFLKLGDDLAGQVSSRKVTDADAKRRLAAGSADLDKM